jgi:hypothetical protein
MFTINQPVKIVDHSEDSYNGKIGIIKAIERVRQHTFYIVDIQSRLVPCTDDELMED